MKKFFFLLLLFLNISYAQTINLQECIDKSLANHPDIKTFVLDIAKDEQKYRMAYGEYLPHITLQTEYDFQHTFALPQNSTFHTIDKTAWQAGAVLNQKIYDFGKTSSLIKAADKSKEITALSLEEAKKLLAFKVTALYQSVLVEQKAIEVRKKDMQLKEELYNQSKALVKAGLKTTSDETRFLSAFYAAQDLFESSKAELDKTLNSLTLYTGETIDPQTYFETPDTIQYNENPEKYMQMLLHNNTELHIYDKESQKNRLEYSSAKSAHYGSLDFTAAYTHYDNLSSYDSSLAAVTFSLPIFAGEQISANEQSAAIAVNINESKKASKVLSLTEELKSLLIDVKHLQDTIKAKESQIVSALSTKTLVEGRYKEGLSTYIEVLDAASFYVSSQLELLQARYSLSMTNERIKYLIEDEK